MVDGQIRPRKGDRVKLRDCSLRARGIVVDEYSRDYVSVQWDDLPSPATYRRAALELDELCVSSGMSVAR